MAIPRMIKRDRAAEYRHFVIQKQLVERHFPCFRCTLRKNILECVGEIVPSAQCSTYQIGIRYRNDGIPEVRIRRPEIPNRIHMYGNGNLCLYDYREQPWSAGDNIHEKIIPWTAEWLVFYELYLICGKWLGPEAAHGVREKKPEEALAA
jgi:hypothetical protein